MFMKKDLKRNRKNRCRREKERKRKNTISKDWMESKRENRCRQGKKADKEKNDYEKKALKV